MKHYRQLLTILYGSMFALLGILTAFFNSDTHSLGYYFVANLPDRFFSGLSILFIGLLLLILRVAGDPIVLVILDVFTLYIFSMFMFPIVESYPNLPIGAAFIIPVWMSVVWLLKSSCIRLYYCLKLNYNCPRDCKNCKHIANS